MTGLRGFWLALAFLPAAACSPEPVASSAEAPVVASAQTASAEPGRAGPAQPVSGSGQNYSFDASGPLQIVGPPSQYDILLPTDVLFDFDKDVLRPDSAPLLAQLKAHFASHDADQLHVTGHTDAKGDDAYNFRLSQRRALAVCTWLKANTDEDFTNCIGRGEAEPVAPNETADGGDDPVGRQRNRRVAIRVIDYPDAGAMIADAKAQADAARATLPD